MSKIGNIRGLKVGAALHYAGVLSAHARHRWLLFYMRGLRT